MNQAAKKLSAEVQAEIRRSAVLRVLDGEPPAAVTRSYGLAPKTIYRWLQTAKEKGVEALAPIPRTGRNRILTAEEELRVYDSVMTSYPYQFGYSHTIWSKQALYDFVSDNYGVNLSGSSILRMLERFGLAPRQLKADLLSSSEAAEQWVETDYRKIRQTATNRNAEILWLNNIPMKKDFILKPHSAGETRSRSKMIATLFTLKGKFCCLPYSKSLKANQFLKLLKIAMRDRERPLFIIAKPCEALSDIAVKNYIHLYKDQLTIFEIPA